MRTGRAIAFWREFEACVNGAYKHHFGSRDERWEEGWGGGGYERSSTVGLGSKHWERLNDSGSVRVKETGLQVADTPCKGKGNVKHA